LLAGADLVARYAEADEDYAREAAGGWMWGAVWCLSRSGRLEEAIAVSERLIAHFQREQDPVVLGRLGVSLFGVGRQLAWGEPRGGRLVTVFVLWALAAGDKVETIRWWPFRTAMPTTGRRLEEYASRHFSRVGWGSRRERFMQALRIFDVLISRTRGDDEAGLQKLLVKAEMGRGSALLWLGRIRDRFGTFDNVFDHGHDGIGAVLRSARSPAGEGVDSVDLAAAIAATRIKTGGEEGPAEETRLEAERVFQQAARDDSASARLVAWIGRNFSPANSRV
jgi:hypothetical protein